MYKIDESESNVMSAKYGEWKSDVGLTVFQRNVWRRRANFKGHEIRYAPIFDQKRIGLYSRSLVYISP